MRLVPLISGLALAVSYSLLRRRIMTWGATGSEASARLPGDELLEDADGVSTRAITIDAPAGAVWPWLAQMGPSPRGGAYTYDWIENLLGLDMHSVDRVLPEFQHPEVGDTIGLGANRMRLARVEQGRVLSWRSQDGNWVWTFVLDEHEGSTRLISRNRFRLPTLMARLGMLPMEPASLVMERKMLLGIKARAERLARTEADGVPCDDGVGPALHRAGEPLVLASSGGLPPLPACQPGARPPVGTRTDSTSRPLQVMSHEIRELEFHISPARLSSRPQTSGGTAGTRSRRRRASAGRLSAAVGCRRLRRYRGSLRRASDGPRSERSGSVRPSGLRRHPRRPRRARPVVVAHGRLLDDEPPFRHAHHERRVVEIARRPALGTRCHSLVDTPVQPHGVPTGAEREPVELDAVGRSRSFHCVLGLDGLTPGARMGAGRHPAVTSRRRSGLRRVPLRRRRLPR